MVGRPVARNYDDGLTLEVNRTATDGTKNANSCLYGAAWRAAKALGYQRLITYTQEGESGASLRAAGWRVLAERKERKGWSVPSRPREDRGTDGVQRLLWEANPRSVRPDYLSDLVEAKCARVWDASHNAEVVARAALTPQPTSESENE